MNCTPRAGHRSNLWVLFMAKHSELLKLKVVREYLGGGRG